MHDGRGVIECTTQDNISQEYYNITKGMRNSEPIAGMIIANLNGQYTEVSIEIVSNQLAFARNRLSSRMSH
jgi:hypothetical protein